MINGLFVILGRDGPDHTAPTSGGRLWRNAELVGERCGLHLLLSVAGGFFWARGVVGRHMGTASQEAGARFSIFS